MPPVGAGSDPEGVAFAVGLPFFEDAPEADGFAGAVASGAIAADGDDGVPAFFAAGTFGAGAPGLGGLAGLTAAEAGGCAAGVPGLAPAGGGGVVAGASAVAGVLDPFGAGSGWPCIPGSAWPGAGLAALGVCWVCKAAFWATDGGNDGPMAAGADAVFTPGCPGAAAAAAGGAMVLVWPVWFVTVTVLVTLLMTTVLCTLL